MRFSYQPSMLNRAQLGSSAEVVPLLMRKLCISQDLDYEIHKCQCYSQIFLRALHGNTPVLKLCAQNVSVMHCSL